jgi:hypothetical protein
MTHRNAFRAPRDALENEGRRDSVIDERLRIGSIKDALTLVERSGGAQREHQQRT